MQMWQTSITERHYTFDIGLFSVELFTYYLQLLSFVRFTNEMSSGSVEISSYRDQHFKVIKVWILHRK